MDNKKSKAKKILERKLENLNDWLHKAKGVHDAVPYVQQACDHTKWQLDVIGTMPDAIAHNFDDRYLNKIHDSQEFLSKNFYLSSYPTSTLATLSGITVSDSTSTYQIALIDDQTGSPETNKWITEKRSSYRELQKKQHTNEIILEKLSILHGGTAQEFTNSVQAYTHAISETLGTTSAAILCRNVLEHMKGNLFKKAISNPREQKIKWDQMAQRLARNGSEGIESRALINEGERHANIHNRLSLIAKNLEKMSPEQFVNIYMEYIDHLYTVLNLIDDSVF